MSGRKTFVKVRYTGDLAKNAVALADSGFGYIVLEKGVDRGEKYAVLAMTHVYTEPIQPPLVPLTYEENLKVTRILNKRFKSERKM